MDGSMNLTQSLAERLKLLSLTPDDILAFAKAHPVADRLTPGAADLVHALQARGTDIYLVSGGFRELIMPLARLLNIPARNVMANRMNWQISDGDDEETGDGGDRGGATPRVILAGFDETQPVARNKGKPQAIRALRAEHPYATVVMVGDGITDLEAVQETGAADLFVGYGGVIERAAVVKGASWFVHSHAELLSALRRYTAAIIGSGAWACAAARIVAQNALAADPADEFTDEVQMWVYEEEYEGRSLADVINERHENPRYLPGITLPDNLVARSDLAEVAADADILVFCVPHQFMRGIVRQLRGKIKPGAIAVSLTKGMRVRPEGPQLISTLVMSELRIDCSVLMGANLADAIGREELSEATLGYQVLDNAAILTKLFDRPYFHVQAVPDVAGAEMAGTLKNIVALAAGFVDGLGLGPNSKAAVMRAGLAEMRRLSRALYPGVRDETFGESCGVADLIATCIGGRNRMVAARWAAERAAGHAPTFEALEAELLCGQKLQGVLTATEVAKVLAARGWAADYPLFSAVHAIVSGWAPVEGILDYRRIASDAVAAGLFQPPGQNGDGGDGGGARERAKKLPDVLASLDGAALGTR